MRSPLRRPAAAVAAALLFLLTACGDGDGDGSAQAVRDSAGQVTPETTTSTVAATTTTAVVPSTTTTAAARARTTTTAARAGASATTTAAGARALTPAAPGTYRFDTSGATTFAGTTVPFPVVTTLLVDSPTGTLQRLTRNLRDAAGNGLSSEFSLDYRPEGVFLVSLKLTTGFSGVTDARELRPASPVLLLPTGAKAGTHVEADLGGAPPARLVVDVVGEEQVTIAGKPVDTLVIRVAVTLPPGDVTGRQEVTLNVDRATRLWVKERSVTDASAAGGLFVVHSEYTATLQRLTP